MKTKKAIALAEPSALFLALLPALLVLHMIADNNNGELYDPVTNQWDIAYAFQVGAIVYVPAYLAIFAIVFVLTGLWLSRATRS